MATTTNITTTYQGESAGKYVAAALLSANTIENGGVTVLPNVKFRTTMKRVDTTSLLANAGCDFAATSTITLTERTLEPKELQVNIQFCRMDFRDDWDAISMGYSVYDTLPPSFQEFIIAQFISKIAQANETNLWQGAVAVAGQYGGFNEAITTAIAALQIPLAQQIPLVGGGLTVGNIIAELGKMVDALPPSLYGRDDLKIYVPQAVAKLYIRALGGFTTGIGAAGLNNQGTTWYTGNANALTFDGIPLFLANGLNSNKMVATYVENLYFATGVLNDANEVRLIDMSPTDGSQNVRFVMRMTAAANIAIAEDCVVYNY